MAELSTGTRSLRSALAALGSPPLRGRGLHDAVFAEIEDGAGAGVLEVVVARKHAQSVTVKDLLKRKNN